MTRCHPRPQNRAGLPRHVGLVAAELFQSKGYARVTMEQVAARAGVSKRTLYKYFPVKEALLERMLEDALADDLAGRDFAAQERAGFRAGVAELLHESARWCEQRADVLLPYIRYKFASFDPGAVPAQDRGVLPLWTMLIEAAQERGELLRNQESRRLAIYFHYLYLGALMRWLTEPGLDLRGEFDTVIALFLDGAADRRVRDKRVRRGTARAGRSSRPGTLRR